MGRTRNRMKRETRRRRRVIIRAKKKKRIEVVQKEKLESWKGEKTKTKKEPKWRKEWQWSSHRKKYKNKTRPRQDHVLYCQKELRGSFDTRVRFFCVASNGVREQRVEE